MGQGLRSQSQPQAQPGIALKHLGTLETKTPEQAAKIKFLEGKAHYQLGRYDLAEDCWTEALQIELFEPLVKQHPKNRSLALTLGQPFVRFNNDANHLSGEPDPGLYWLPHAGLQGCCPPFDVHRPFHSGAPRVIDGSFIVNG